MDPIMCEPLPFPCHASLLMHSKQATGLRARRIFRGSSEVWQTQKYVLSSSFILSFVLPFLILPWLCMCFIWNSTAISVMYANRFLPRVPFSLWITFSLFFLFFSVENDLFCTKTPFLRREDLQCTVSLYCVLLSSKALCIRSTLPVHLNSI